MDIPKWCVWVPMLVFVVLVSVIAVACWELVWWCIGKMP